MDVPLVAGVALALVSVGLRTLLAPWARGLAAAAALASLFLAPPVGAVAVALATLRPPGWPWVAGELLAAATVAVWVGGGGGGVRIVLAIAAAALAAGFAQRLPYVLRVPALRALPSLLATAAALALVALLVVDDRRGVVPGDAVWRALALGIVVALAGALGGVAAFGGATVLATRTPLRGLLLASVAAAMVAAGIAGATALAGLLPAAAVCAAVGAMRSLRAVFPPSMTR